MAIPIERILTKEGRWTGDDLGRVYVMERSAVFKSRERGEPINSPDSPFSVTEAHMEILNSDRHRHVFGNYVAMMGWIERRLLQCEAHIQQAQVQYRTLDWFLAMASFSEDVYRYVAKTRDKLDDPKVAVAMDARLEYTSLSSFLPASPYTAIRTKVARESRKALLDSYYYVHGFNYAMDRIAALHHLSDVLVYKRGLYLLDERIDDLNKRGMEVYRKLKAGGHPDRKLQKDKLFVLARFFDVIDPKAIGVRDRLAPEIDRLIETFKGFQLDDERSKVRLDRMLFVRSEGEAAHVE